MLFSCQYSTPHQSAFIAILFMVIDTWSCKIPNSFITPFSVTVTKHLVVEIIRFFPSIYIKVIHINF